MFGSQIRSLPELDTHIPLHAIAGREVLGGPVKLWNAQVNLLSAFGDFVVPERSALHQRPGGTQTVRTVTNNPDRLFDFSAAHPNLPKNPEIIQLVRGYVSDYLLAHPAPAPVQTTPALGGDAYWLADGGRWYVHGATLHIGPGMEGSPNLTGTETLYAGATNHGTIDIVTWNLIREPDGSLLGEYFSSRYTSGTGGPVPSGFQSDYDDPRPGQVIRLVPVAPMHAKIVYVSRPGPDNGSPGPVGGNDNWCQQGLPNATQYCGA
jgi:hypothetical protein